MILASNRQHKCSRSIDEHDLKAAHQIDFTEEGFKNDVCVSIEHDSKAAHSIEVIEEGISICVSDEHESKASVPIDFTGEGIENDIW